jgi:hypothetical protein
MFLFLSSALFCVEPKPKAQLTMDDGTTSAIFRPQHAVAIMRFRSGLAATNKGRTGDESDVVQIQFRVQTLVCGRKTRA